MPARPGSNKACPLVGHCLPAVQEENNMEVEKRDLWREGPFIRVLSLLMRE